MPAVQNKAAWAKEAGSQLVVDAAPMPTAGPGEIVVKNTAIAINPLDTHMLDSGMFVQKWPAVFGCDVAGQVHDIGPDVKRFKKGDRVIGHTVLLTHGRVQDGGYALYTTILVDKAALLPDNIPYTDGVVLPTAIEAASCALHMKETSMIMPDVWKAVLGLPYPSTEDHVPPIGKTLVVYGGNTSVGSMTIQLATAAGVKVISISSKKNAHLSRQAGAVEVIDYKEPAFIDKVVAAIKAAGGEFAGIFDAPSSFETYAHDIEIITKVGHGYLAVSHPPPTGLPDSIKSGMIFAVDDIATPIWRNFITPALEKSKLRCLPVPTVVGKGLESIQKALDRYKAGVNAEKLVVEL